MALHMLLVALLLGLGVCQGGGKEASCSADPATPVRVFVVPLSYNHGNDASGADEATSGSILDSVAEHFSTPNSRYRFNWADTASFRTWHQKLDSTRRHTMEKHIRDGRFEFVGGGMVQQSGASSTVEETIQQMSAGHAYLADALSTRPRVAWQVDGSGLSGILPYILDAMAFSAVVIDVAKPSEVKRRSKARELEFVWRPDDASAGTLAHILPSGLASPKGLDFEKSDADITKDTVKEFSEIMAHEVRERVAHLRTRNVMIPFGGEHSFRNASKQFKNMDRLMAYVAAQPSMGFSMQYSTMSEYLETVRACAEDAEFWPEHLGGFAPPAAGESSAPAAPTYAAATTIRKASQDLRIWLRAADLLFLHSLEVSAPLKGDPSVSMEMLLAAREELAMSQHFRATSGQLHRAATASYVTRLQHHTKLCQQLVAQSTRTIVSVNSTLGAAIVKHDSYMATQALEQGGEMGILVTNLLGWRQNVTISVDVPEDLALGVTDQNGIAVLSQISKQRLGSKTLHFQGELPGLGIRAFFVRQVMQSAVSLADPSAPEVHTPTGPAVSKLEIILEGGRLKAIFSDLTGRLLALEDIAKGTRMAVHHEIVLHTTGDDAKLGTSDLFTGGRSEISVEHGSIVSEITQSITDLPQLGGYGSLLQVKYRVFTGFAEDVLGSVLSVQVQVEGVPPNTVVVSKISTDFMKGQSSIMYDQGELGFQKLPIGPTKKPAFHPMASSAVMEAGGEALALLSPVSTGVYSGDGESVHMALYERAVGGDPRDHGAKFEAAFWLTLTNHKSTSHLQLAKMLRHPHVMSFTPAPNRRIWRESFRGILEPLKGILKRHAEGTGLIDPRIHVLTAHVRDNSLDSAVIRFVNTAEVQGSVKMDLGTFFSGMQLQQWKAESLALSYTNSSNDEASAHDEMWGMKHVVIPGRSVQTLTALLNSAQPFDHVHFFEDPEQAQKAAPSDIVGNKQDFRVPNNPTANSNSKENEEWLYSTSLAGGVRENPSGSTTPSSNPDTNGADEDWS